MMLPFELYRILAAQRIAEMLREMDRDRLAAQATADHPGGERHPHVETSTASSLAPFRSPIRHTE